MKIFINGLSSRRGGSLMYLQNILYQYPESCENEVIVIAPKTLFVPKNRQNIKRLKIPEIFVVNPFARFIWEVFFLPKLLVRLNINVLFCPGGAFSGRLPKNCKLVTTFQNMIPFDMSQRLKYSLGYMRARNWMLERKLFSSMMKSDLIIFISNYAKSIIEKKANNIIFNSVTIPHGVDPKFRRESNKNLICPDQFPDEYFLYVSTLDVYKAQVEVVKAYSLLKSRKSKIPKLIFIGSEYAAYGKKVREVIKKNNMEEHILIKEAIPNKDLPALYQNASINIFASMTENCPFILLEALAAGRPLVVSNYPPMPEFSGDAVEYFDPSVPEELADLLEKILDNDILSASLSKKALECSTHYDWSVSAKRTWESINSL